MKRKAVQRLIKTAVARDRKARVAKPEAPKLAVVQGGAPRRMKINPDLLARAKAMRPRGKLDQSKPRVDPFAVYQPPPGVVPAGHKLAMDEALSGALTWATQATISGMWTEGLTFLGYPYLAELSQRPEYRVISSVIATEMTRNWIEFQASEGEDGEDKTDRIKQLEDFFKQLGVQDAFYQLAEQDGFFGRTHLFLDACNIDDKDELIQDLGDGVSDASKMKVNQKNPLRSVRVIEPIWCYPQRYNSSDPLQPDWYKPETWYVMTRPIHASRLLTFVGHKVPDILKPAYAFGGLSRSQLAKPYVDNWLSTRQSVNDLIKAFSVMVLMTDISSQLSASNSSLDGSFDGGTTGSAMLDRADLFNAFRDNRGLFIINKDTEDFKNVTTPLSTLDALQAQSQEHMAAVARIPLVKLLGISPAGLNATAEPEIRVFYDTIHAFQEQFFRPGLERVMNFAMLSLWGEVDSAITLKFKPLWSLDEKASAEVRKVEAETDDILVNGVASLSPEESRKRIAADPDTPYASLDVDDMPEPPAGEIDPATGMPAEGGGSSNISLRGTQKFGKGPAGEEA